MATQKELEEAISALLPIIDLVSKFEKEYGALLREYRARGSELTEEERNETAIRMLSKYSNL